MKRMPSGCAEAAAIGGESGQSSENTRDHWEPPVTVPGHPAPHLQQPSAQHPQPQLPPPLAAQEQAEQQQAPGNKNNSNPSRNRTRLVGPSSRRPAASGSHPAHRPLPTSSSVPISAVVSLIHHRQPQQFDEIIEEIQEESSNQGSGEGGMGGAGGGGSPLDSSDISADGDHEHEGHHRLHRHHHRRSQRSQQQGQQQQQQEVVYPCNEPILVRGNGNMTLFGLSNTFSTEFPASLMGRVSKEEFELSIARVNQLLRQHHSTNAKLLLLGCLCCCCSFGCSLLWPTLALSKRTRAALEKLLAAENHKLYNKLGLNWKLSKERCHSNHAFMEYVLYIDFIPKLHMYQPD